MKELEQIHIYKYVEVDESDKIQQTEIMKKLVEYNIKRLSVSISLSNSLIFVYLSYSVFALNV